MINMGDDGDISELIYHGWFQLAKRAKGTRFDRFKQCFYKINIDEGYWNTTVGRRDRASLKRGVPILAFTGSASYSS